MTNLTWLHISDLHWRESQAYDANVVAQALLRDLAHRTDIAPELARIDFIFVTGDIAFAGRPEEYALAHHFLDDLRSTTSVPKHRLFIVPGNHDIDRNAISDDAVRVVSALSNRQAINRLLGDEVDRAVTMQRFHRYQQFVNSYFKRLLSFDSTRYFYVKERNLIGKRIAILGLNSAWASASDADRHNLFLGEQQVRTCLELAIQADIRIALMHHPFDWLRDSDREDCEPLLVRGCDFVLHGHLHRTGVMSLRAPGSEAMIIGAGACYETREYTNAYNLVHLDFDSGEGVIYLRMYSDREGGFWTKDLMTYQDAPGVYLFDLPRSWFPTRDAKLVGDTATGRANGHGTNGGTVPDVPIAHREKALEKWWRSRRYRSNPFAWKSTESVDKECLDKVGANSLSELFEWWHVDPNIHLHERESTWRRLKRALGGFPARVCPRLFIAPAAAALDEYEKRKRGVLHGLGGTPTLEKIVSLRTNEPILIYAPEGGGKTFYRQWAAQQVEEQERLQHALEIPNFAACVEEIKNVTACKLALGIYEYLCDRFSINADPPQSKNTYRVLDRCDKVLRRYFRGSQAPLRVHVFVDGVNQLFDEDPSEVNHNDDALVSIVDLCKAAAKLEGLLALRFFMPAQLETYFEQRLGTNKRVKRCTISWSEDHIEAMLERRLNSFWAREIRDTGPMHVDRLFTADALYEFRKWLRQQESVSPRCVIETIDRLADYARSKVTLESQISVRMWKEFIGTDKMKPSPCGADTDYPLRQLRLISVKRLWPVPLLAILLGVVLNASPSIRGVLETTFFSLADLARRAIAWLAAISDWVEGFILFVVVLGSGAFVFWCLKESTKRGQRPALRECIRQVWQLIRQNFPGGS